MAEEQTGETIYPGERKLTDDELRDGYIDTAMCLALNTTRAQKDMATPKQIRAARERASQLWEETAKRLDNPVVRAIVEIDARIALGLVLQPHLAVHVRICLRFLVPGCHVLITKK